MTKEEAKKIQEDIVAKGHELGWWYGVDCQKCCEVYPKFVPSGAFGEGCFYRCPVCGRRTKEQPMPWVARDAWNNGEFISGGQLSFF